MEVIIIGGILCCCVGATAHESENNRERQNAKKLLGLDKNKNSIENNYLLTKIDNQGWPDKKRKIYELLYKTDIEVHDNYVKIIFNEKIENSEVIKLYCIEKLKMRQPLEVSVTGSNLTGWEYVVKIVNHVVKDMERNNTVEAIPVCEEIEIKSS